MNKKEQTSGLKLAEVDELDSRMLQVLCDLTLLTREDLAAELGIKRVSLQWIISHGRIKKIHLSKIEKLAGVRLVMELPSKDKIRIYLDDRTYIPWKKGDEIPEQLVQKLISLKQQKTPKNNLANFSTEDLIREIESRGWRIKAWKPTQSKKKGA